MGSCEFCLTNKSTLENLVIAVEKLTIHLEILGLKHHVVNNNNVAPTSIVPSATPFFCSSGTLVETLPLTTDLPNLESSNNDDSKILDTYNLTETDNSINIQNTTELSLTETPNLRHSNFIKSIQNLDDLKSFKSEIEMNCVNEESMHANETIHVNEDDDILGTQNEILLEFMESDKLAVESDDDWDNSEPASSRIKIEMDEHETNTIETMNTQTTQNNIINKQIIATENNIITIPKEIIDFGFKPALTSYIDKDQSQTYVPLNSKEYKKKYDTMLKLVQYDIMNRENDTSQSNSNPMKSSKHTIYHQLTLSEVAKQTIKILITIKNKQTAAFCCPIPECYHYTICDYSTTIKRHIESHSSFKSYGCHICNIRTGSLLSLKRHYNMHHQEVGFFKAGKRDGRRGCRTANEEFRNFVKFFRPNDICGDFVKLSDCDPSEYVY